MLLVGVPWSQGALPANAGLHLHAGDEVPVACWWDVRSRWPDGSARWIFLHARLQSAVAAPSSTNRTDLFLQPAAAGELPACELVDGVLQLADTRLQIEADGSWCLQSGDRHLHLEGSRATVDGQAYSLHGPARVELVEASQIAPLVRICPAHDGDSGPGALRSEQLLRLEPGGGLHWQQRLSFHADRVSCLGELTSRFSTGPGTHWTWPRLAPAPRHHLQVLRPGYMRTDAEPETIGYPEARLASDRGDLWLEKGWQRAPFGLAPDADGVTVELYPAEAAPLSVHPGTSFRHSVRFHLTGTAQAPVQVSLDPETACASGVFGPMMERTELTARRYPGFERAIEACLHHGRLGALEKSHDENRGSAAALLDESSQDEEYFGLQHYGDWPMKLGAYGGQRRMYADNEYDVPYAYWLQYIRTGDTTYAGIAAHSAVHMGDVDCKSTDGDMLFHGYRDKADDHGDHRVDGGDLGHYWTDGLMLHWLLQGDIWSREAAVGVADFLCRRFDGHGDEPIRDAFLGCERSVGWPLVALAGVQEHDPTPVIGAHMQAMVSYLARFTADPDRELEQAHDLGVRWWRICQQDGTKPFMLGVVMEGLERHHRLTGDPAAAEALCHIARFLVDVMWVEGVEAFIYEWNAFNRGHREEVYPHYINMMVSPGLAYAYELTGERRYRDVATRAFHAALWTLLEPGGGKEIGMVGRTSSLMVARLYQWRQADEAQRQSRMTPSDGVTFSWSGTAQRLQDDQRLNLVYGMPRYEGGALVSADDSCAVYNLRDRTATNQGRVAFTVTPDWDCPEHPGPVAQRAYLHLCDRTFTQSCVSIISFYTGLHARFYDAERNYITVLEADIQHWRAGVAHRIEVAWDAHENSARLVVYDEDTATGTLPRRLSGAFTRLHLGHRPGNWRADARITDLEFELT